jgi:hypothetical protein
LIIALDEALGWSGGGRVRFLACVADAIITMQSSSAVFEKAVGIAGPPLNASREHTRLIGSQPLSARMIFERDKHKRASIRKWMGREIRDSFPAFQES